MAARTKPASPGTGGHKTPDPGAHPAREQSIAAGKAARQLAPLESHRDFAAAASRDPVGLVLGQAESRVPELVPVRHGRMLVSPFAYYRGAAMTGYGRMCGWTLARAHARTGDRIAIAAYLGGSDKFDHAVADFAESYADQTERDHTALADAVASGRVQAQVGI